MGTGEKVLVVNPLRLPPEGVRNCSKRGASLNDPWCNQKQCLNFRYLEAAQIGVVETRIILGCNAYCEMFRERWEEYYSVVIQRADCMVLRP